MISTTQINNSQVPLFVPFDEDSNNLITGFQSETFSQIQNIWNDFQTQNKSPEKKTTSSSLIPLMEEPKCFFCSKNIENEIHVCDISLTLPIENDKKIISSNDNEILPIMDVKNQQFLIQFIHSLMNEINSIQIDDKNIMSLATFVSNQLYCVPCGKSNNCYFPTGESAYCFEPCSTKQNYEPETEIPPEELPEEEFFECFSTLDNESSTFSMVSLFENTSIQSIPICAILSIIITIIHRIRIMHVVHTTVTTTVATTLYLRALGSSMLMLMSLQQLLLQLQQQQQQLLLSSSSCSSCCISGCYGYCFDYYDTDYGYDDYFSGFSNFNFNWHFNSKKSKDKKKQQKKGKGDGKGKGKGKGNGNSTISSNCSSRRRSRCGRFFSTTRCAIATQAIAA